MDLPDQLIDQARSLANQDPRRPRQASVRRAISAAYYALFHSMVAEATAMILPASDRVLKHNVTRAFQHGTMKKACAGFKSGVGALPPGLAECYRGTSIDPDVQRMCSTFVQLQNARHRADYDLSQNVSRSEALKAVAQASRSLRACRRAARQGANRPFFLGLLLWDKMR